MKIRGVLLAACIVLCSCSSNQSFDCPRTGGVRCQSMSEIDKLVDQGKLEDKKVSKAKHTRLSVQEGTAKVWMAGYMGDDGTYHYPSLLNIKLKPVSDN